MDIDNDQLGKDARGAYQLITSEYGERLVSRLVGLHSGLHEQAEGDNLTSEQRSSLIVKAAGVKQCIDLILKEAQLVSSGQLEAMEKAEKLANLQEEAMPA